MRNDTVAGYKRISRGFKLGVAGFVLILIIVASLLGLLAGKVITESSKLLGVVYAVAWSVPILSMVLIINGIVEVNSNSDSANKTKKWFAIQLIFSAVATVASVFTNLISERFYDDASFSNSATMLINILITSVGGYVIYYLSYINLMREYENVIEMYGFEESMKKRIKLSEVLLKISNFSLVVSELGFFIYVSIVIKQASIENINRGFVLFILGIMVLAKLIRIVNYLLMMIISSRVAKDIEEISK